MNRTQLREKMEQSMAQKGMRVFLVCGVLLIYAVFLCLCLYIPLVKGGYVQGMADISFHMNRILSIADGLRGGQFPVKIYPDALSGYGYGSPLFYPDLFLYLPALLTLAGVPVAVSYTLFATALVFAMGGFYYLFARKIFALKGSLFTACFAMSGHFNYAIFFATGGLGQASAACFAPLILLGIYNMVRENFSKPWILLVAMLCVTFCHTLSLALYGLFLIGVVLVFAKKLMTDASWWKKVGIIFAIYLGMTACYFVPLLEQYASASFLQQIPWAFLSDGASSFLHLIFNDAAFWRRGSAVLFCIGIVAILCACLRVFVKKTDENRRALTAADWLLGVGLGLQVLCLDIFPWEWLDHTPINTIQFPFRLLMISALILPVAIGLVVRELFRAPRIRLPRAVYTVLAIAIVIGSAAYDLFYLPMWNAVDPSPEKLHESIVTGEWLPVYDDIEDLDTYRETFRDKSLYDEEGNEVAYMREAHTVTISWQAEAGKTYTLPLVYYKGYAATDDAGNKLSVSPSSLGKVVVEAETSGMIVVTYEGTAWQDVSAAVTGATICGVTVYLCLQWKKKFLQKNG